MRMKPRKKGILITFILYYLALWISTITLLFLHHEGIAMLLGLPTFFLLPIYLTFSHVPERTDRHRFFLIMSILLRYLLITLALLIPALLWYYLPDIKAKTNAIFLLLPFFEVFIVYNIVNVENILDAKQIKDKEKKKE